MRGMWLLAGIGVVVLFFLSRQSGAWNEQTGAASASVPVTGPRIGATPTDGILSWITNGFKAVTADANTGFGGTFTCPPNAMCARL